MTDVAAVLREVLEPALQDAIAALSGTGIGPGDRRRLADRLAAAAEVAQRRLGEEAREPRLHAIVGVAASASMALALGDGVVPISEVRERLQEGLQKTAGSWPPEDQDPAG